MAYHYVLRNNKKKSLSESLDIGAGRYVHNLEFTSNSENTKVTHVGTSGISVDEKKSSWEDISNGKIGTYVDNVEYPTIVDITGDSPEIQDAKIPSVQNNNDTMASLSKNTSSFGTTNVTNADPTSTVARGGNSTLDLLQKSPNFSKLHEQYKDEWYKNHPPNETRPMRLTEFIWSHCGKDNPYNVDYLSDDTRDKELKAIKENCSKSIRETLMERDEQYLAEVAIKDSKYKYLYESCDDNSFKSAVSNESLIDVFSPTDECEKKVDDDDSIHSSSIVSVKDGGTLIPASDTLANVQPTDVDLVDLSATDGTNNTIVSKSNQLHIPDGFMDLYYSSESDNTKCKKLKDFKGYMTDSLKEEMSLYYPKSDHVTRDSLTNDVIMDKTQFSTSFTKMFPKNRIFLNYLQLRLAVTEFLKHWNLLCKSTRKSFRCSYSHTPAKKKVISENTNENDNSRQSTSSLVRCPFEIRWSLIDHKTPHRHDIFYKVKISRIVSTEHTCLMSHISYRHAMKTSNGHNKIDLNNMNTAVSVLKLNPSMPAQMLRPLLKDCLPCHTNIDAKFVDNFRRRVAIHHAKYPNQAFVSLEECKALSRHQDLTQSDYLGMNDPMVRTNLNTMYGKIMENDSKVWSALQFLTKCKETINGFDYRILRGKAGNPTAILYMTSRMRYNLIRYGNIMFIDGQKRKYNKLNWPYIGPVVKNSDNRIGVTCEAIVTTEDTDTYTWIFKSMQSIEPRWSPAKLQILYADGLVTKKLLNNLDITVSCILHGDYYHLMKENWPKPENFGSVVFSLIKPHLIKMLLSKTKSEWDLAFNEASSKIQAYPLKLELLQNIYNDPDYYAGYITRKIVGNLSLNGTAPSEQNHSSIVAFNGEIMLGSICDHLKSLCERQQQICNKENDFETDYFVRSTHYKPRLDGQFAYEELRARQALSQIPFSNYFVKQLKGSESLQTSPDGMTEDHRVWPSGTTFDINEDNHVVIQRGERCTCWRRIDYDIQCKHELRLDPKFKVEHWGSRWLNRREFNKRNTGMSTFDTNAEIICLDDEIESNKASLNNCNEVVPQKDNHEETHSLQVENNDSEVEAIAINSILEEPNSKITYSDVLEMATDLCRTVAENPKLCKSTYGTLLEWITKLRRGDKFSISFHNQGLPDDSSSNFDNHPQAAVVTPKPNGRSKRQRYKSRSELQRKNYKVQRTCVNDDDYIPPNNTSLLPKSSISSNIDEIYVCSGGSEKKYCFLCRQPKCTRWNCKILQRYEKMPGRILPKGHQEARDKLISLLSNVDNHVLCHNRQVDDSRLVFNEVPRKIKAMVVSKKYVLEDNISHMSPHDNVCIECTLLGYLGVPMANYTEALFKKHCIIRFIGKSKQNLVVDNIS